MKSEKKIATCVLAILLVNRVAAQDIHFSQFYAAPLTQNPAMAGVNYDFALNLNYKDQWRSVGAPYKTMAASADSKLNKKRADHGYFAGGINFFSDRAGDSNMGTTQANFSLAYQAVVGLHQTLGGGIQAGFAQRSMLYDGLTWGNQFDGFNYDPDLPTGEKSGGESFTYGDLGVGVVWAYNNTDGHINVTDNHDLKFNLGLSAFHLTRPKYTFMGMNDRLYMKFVLHGNGLISVPSTKMAFVPGFMIYRQGKLNEIMIGSLIRYKLQQDSKYTGYREGAAMSFGGYWRTRDAFIIHYLFEFSQFAIGASYDVNTSSLRHATHSRGGFEISLRFTSKNPFMNGVGHSARFN